MPTHRSPSGLNLMVPLDSLTDAPAQYAVVATEAERRALAQRFGVKSLSAFAAEITVTRLHGGTNLHVAGHLSADLVQDCVVSLEPIEQHVGDAFQVDFGPSADVLDAESGELLLSPGVEDPEPMPQGALDLGELLAEHLALAIDPYPRKPGIELEQVLQKNGIDVKVGRASPFAVLSELKSKS